MSHLKNICFIIDIENWAFFYKANYLKKYLKEFYNVDIVKFSNANYNNYDLIIQFTPINGNFDKYKHKILCGVSSFGSLKPYHLEKYDYFFSNDFNIFSSIPRDNKWYTPNGVEVNVFNGGVKTLKNSNKVTIGAVGSLSRKEHKGYTRINNICDLLNKENVDIDRRLLFKDSINNKTLHNDMVKYYDNLDLYIVSSISEATPNPLLESMAMGVPCVSNNTGMATLLLEPKYIIEDYDDLNSYKEVIFNLINDTEEYERVSKRNLNKVQEYSWEKMSVNYKKMIDNFFENFYKK